MSTNMVGAKSLSLAQRDILKKRYQSQGLSSATVRQEEENEENVGGILGGIAYLHEKVGLQALSGIEGIWDYTAGGIAKIFGADDWAESQFDNDWVNYGHADEWYNPDEGWSFAGDVAGGIGSSLPTIAAAVGGAVATYYSGGAAAPAAIKLVAATLPSAVAGLGAAGNATKEAYRETGELGAKEFGYGALVGGTEAAIEKVTAGIGTGSGRIISSIAKRSAGELTETLAKSGAKNVLKTLGQDFVSEAFEEGIAEILSPVYQRMTYNPDAENASMQEVAYAALVGGLSGALMSGANVTVNTSQNLISGNKVVSEGKASAVLENARQITERETTYETGYESFKNVANTYNQLSASLAGTNGEVTTVKQKMLLGQLTRENAVATLSPFVERSAENIIRNIDTVVERYNALGMKDANGNPVTFTKEQILSGIDLNADRKTYAKQLRKALSSNSVLATLSVADATGNLVMDTRRFAEMALDGKNLASRADYENFRQNATAEEKAAVGSALGIENFDLVKADDFRAAVEQFAADGKMSTWSEQSKRISAAERISADSAKPLPHILNKNMTDGVRRYTSEDGSVNMAIIKEGTEYRIYNYDTHYISRALTKTEVNKVLRDVRQSAVSQTSEVMGETQKRYAVSDNKKSAIVIEADSELAERIRSSSKSKYTVIRDYLVEKFGGKEFKLSDGRRAIMDKRDAQHLSHLADEVKAAELSDLMNVVERAEFSHEASKVKHDKFDAFRYYAATVKIGKESYDILINVGRSKYDQKHHIYDITKNGGAAGQASPGLSRPVGDAMRNSSSTDSIPQSGEKSNSFPKNNSEEATEKSSEVVSETEKITVGMSEGERADILRNKRISPAPVSESTDFDMDSEALETKDWEIAKKLKKPIVQKLRELGFLKNYKTEAIDVDFEFTGNGALKSANSQILDYGGSLGDFAKVVINLQAILDRAVLLEIHNDKAVGTSKENSRLLQTYVLLGAFQEGNFCTPVQFEIKQYTDNKNRLYLAVALTKIETGVVSDTAPQGEGRTRLLPVSDYSIAELIQKVNTADENFFKYIPDEFLTPEQLEAKHRALAKEAKKYGRAVVTEVISKTEKTTKREGSVTVKADESTLTERQKVSVECLRSLAKAIGVNFVVEKLSTRTRKGRVGENGRFDHKTNTIYLDLNAGNDGEGVILFTASHELTHFIAKWSPKKYKILRETLFEFYGHSNKDVIAMAREQMAAAKEAGHPITFDAAIEEVVADAMERMLTEGNAQTFFESLEKKDKSLVEKIKAYFRDLLAKIRKAYEGAAFQSDEAQFLHESAEAVERMQSLFFDALGDAGETYREIGERAESEGEKEQYSFRNSKSGMANDKLTPYSDELRSIIESRGDYIVDSYKKLRMIVDLAFDEPTRKATVYFGTINKETLEKIKNSIPNLPQDKQETLFKEGREYSIAATLDSIRHVVDDKKLTRADVLDYVDRLADTVVDFDSVAFDVYVDAFKQKNSGLLFKKEFPDGTLISFNLVSHKKRSVSLHTLYLNRADYQKKRSAKTLLMQTASARTPEVRAGQTSNNSIPENTQNVNSDLKNNSEVSYSLRKSNRSTLTAVFGETGESFSLPKVEGNEGKAVADFIDAVSGMIDQSKRSKRKLKIGKISSSHSHLIESLMKTVNPNFSAEGYELWIDGTGADHINRRHGENGQADHSMATREARELIPWVANNPDFGDFIRAENGDLQLSNRYFNADGTKAPQIRLEKKLSNDILYVSECVPDSVNKRVYITSAYIKKGSTNQLLNMDSNESPQPTPEASFDGSATTNSIPENYSDVNSDSKNNSDADYSLRKPGRAQSADRVTMSRGTLQKQKANYTSDRVYSKKDVVSTLNNIEGFRNIPADIRVGYIDEIWRGLNAHVDAEHRETFLDIVGEKLVRDIEAERISFDEGFSKGKITANMLDSERYTVLKNKSILLSAHTDYEKLSTIQREFEIKDEDVEFSKYGDRVRLFKKLGEEFSVFREYSNPDIDISFSFSKENMRESVSKQRKNYMHLVKMLTCLNDVINSAIGIEIHNRNAEGYKADGSLNNVYVLASAFVDGETIIPVKLEVKEFSDKKNTLHVAIALESINKDGIVKQEDADLGVAQQYSPPSNISIAEYFRKINPSDESFYKYIPKPFIEAASDNHFALPEDTESVEATAEFTEELKAGLVEESEREYDADIERAKAKDAKGKYHPSLEKRTVPRTDKERAEYWKTKSKETESRSKVLGNISVLARKMKDLKLGTYHNATQDQSKQFAESVEALSKIVWNGNLSVKLARKHIGALRKWYKQDNAILCYENKDNPGYYNAEIAEMLAGIADADDDTPLSVADLRTIRDIMQYFIKLDETYNKVFKNGKWIDAEPEAKRYIGTINANKPLKVGFLAQRGCQIYMETFSEPLTVARRMDYYARGGFYTETLLSLREAAVNADVTEMEVKADYDAFMRRNKKYLAKATEETVTYRGTAVPRMQLIGLYMTFKRKQAQAGLVINGFYFRDKNGETVRVPGTHPEFGQKKDLTQKDISKAAEAELASIGKLLTKTDKEYIGILEKAFNEDARKLKADTDMQRLGYTNAHLDYYYPIRRGDIAKNIDASTFFDEMARVSNASYNKDTVRGARQKLFIESADSVFNRHVHSVCLYASLSPVIDAYNRIYNLDVSGNPGDPNSVKTASENTWKNGSRYIAKLVADIQGVPASSSEGQKLLGFIRSGYAQYQLGANPKTWVSQISSIFASSSLLDADAITRGMGISAKGIDEYCPLAKLRNNDNTVAKTQGLVERVNKVSGALMAPIGEVDRFVICRLFGACQAQVEKNGGAKVGTEENKIAAGKLLREVILETQQNSAATEKSAAMRSGSEIMRTVTMFSADSMKVLGRVMDSVGEVSVLKAKLKRKDLDAKTRTALENDLKAAHRKARKSVGALMLSSLYMVAIARLFRFLYAKEDDDENAAVSLITDFVGNLFGGLPVLRDVVSFFTEGYEVDNYAYSALNDLLSSAKGLFDAFGSIVSGDASPQDITSGVKRMMYAVGQLFGIPVRNIYNMTYGLTKRFSPETAYKIDMAFYEKNYQNDLYKAVENGDEDMVNIIMGILYGERISDTVPEEVHGELYALSLSGYKMIPRSIPSTVTYNGEELTLTEEDREAVKEVYSGSLAALTKLFGKARYRKLTEEQRAEAINYVYDTYYKIALKDTLGVDRLSGVQRVADVIGVEALALLHLATKDLESDVDRYGNAISGSKRKKVIAAINSLGLSAEKKLLLICMKGYSIQDGDIRGVTAEKAKRHLLKYILSMRGKTRAEKAELAELCGFTVKNGKIVTKAVS